MVRVLKKADGDGMSVYFKNLILLDKALIYNTSFIQKERDGAFTMHRLVRLFDQLEIETGSEECTDFYS